MTRPLRRSLHRFEMRPVKTSEDGLPIPCPLCLKPSTYWLDGFCYCTACTIEELAQGMFHAKVYARSVGAHA